MRTSAPSNLITRAPATPPADRAILDQVDRVASRTRDGAGEPPDHRVEVSGDLADTVGFERSHGRPSPDPTPPVAPPPDGLVLRSSWPDPVIPDVTVPELLLVAAGARRDAPAVIDGPTGRTLTHADLARDVRRAAAGLAARGLGRGDVLAILAPNSPEWLIACYGAMTAGGVVTGIDPLDTPDVIATLLVDSGARFLLTVPPFASAARAALERAGRQIPMIVAGRRTTEGHPVRRAARPRRPAPTGPSTRPPTRPCCPTPAAPPRWPRA